MGTNNNTPSVTTYPTVDEYRAASVSEKSHIRTTVNNAMMAAVAAMDIDAANAARVALESYRDATTRTPATIDWDALVSVRVATLRAAADAIVTGAIVPAGMPDGVTYTVTDAEPVATDVARLAGAPVRRSAVRRDLRSYVADVFAPVTPGTFMRVSDIRHAIIAATDGDYAPTDGAIAAALMSDSGVTGVAFTDATDDMPRGGTRI